MVYRRKNLETELFQAASINKQSRWDDFALYASDGFQNDWSYICYISESSMRSSLSTALLYSLLIDILIGLVGLLVIYYTSHKIYQPVSRFVRSITAGENNISDEFSYLSGAYSEMNLRYEEILTQTKQFAREKALEDLLADSAPEQIAEEIIQENHITIFEESLTIANITLFCNDKELPADTQRILLKQLKETLQYLFEAKNIPCEICTIGFMRLCVLCQTTPAITADIFSHVNDIEQTEYNSFCRCIVSGRVTGVSEAASAYKELLNATESPLNLNTVTMLNEISQNTLPDFFFPLESEREMISEMAMGNPNNAVKILNKIMAVNAQTSSDNVKLSYLRSFLTNTVIRATQTAHIEDSDIISAYIREIKSAKSIAELNKTVADTLQSIAVDIQNCLADKNKHIIIEMVNDITKNLHKDLSISEFADRYNVSQSYLSVLFKKHTGFAFKDYLNNEKIKRAIEIMRETPELKVNELAQSLGFNSADTFIRVFKKYTGTTPGKFGK